MSTKIATFEAIHIVYRILKINCEDKLITDLYKQYIVINFVPIQSFGKLYKSEHEESVKI